MTKWQDIASAPNDRKIDLWAKSWLSDADRFIFERFPDCRYDKGDSMCNRAPSWRGLPDRWHATHWRDVPLSPEAEAAHG